MTEVVVEALKQGALDNAYRLRFLKLGLAQEYLGGLPDYSQQFAHLCEALGGRTAARVLYQGSPFFWKNLHRCCLEGARGSGDLSVSADYMLRMAFDSYFDWLPDGFALSFRAFPDADLVLPQLGIRVPGKGRALTARKQSSQELRIVSADGELAVDLANVPPPLRIRKIEVSGSGGAQLVMVKDPSMFEKDYLDRLDPETEHAEYLAKLIAKSLELVGAAMPELEERFRGFIRWYFPINAPDELTHNSLSVKFMSGAIFLSVAYHDFRLAEAMVHELHHNELFLLQESETLFETDDSNVFYSPFRPDARPLNGLFHALFVFTGVANFIRRAEALDAVRDWHESLHFRRAEVVRQVRFGLEQVPRACLTELGARIIEAIETAVEQHEEEVGRLRGPLPEPLARHLTEWARVHPQLADTVRIPDGVEVLTASRAGR